MTRLTALALPIFALSLAPVAARADVVAKAASPDGRITRWQERIMLPSVPLDDSEIEIVAPVGPDLDIDVKRKA